MACRRGDLSWPAGAGASELAGISGGGRAGCAGPVPDRLGHRHRRAGVRQADWRSKDRAAPVARQDLGGHHRRQHHRGGGVRALHRFFRFQCLLGDAVRLCPQLRGAWRRFVRVPGQAPLRLQGFRRPDPRPWRHAGPHGFHVCRQHGVGAADVRPASQSPVRGACVKAIAATRIFDELPPMDEVLARKVTVLGSTGSIGVNTLDVIAHVRKLHGREAMPITALTAGDNVTLLIEQARAMKPALAVIGNERLFGELKAGLAGTGIEVGAGRLAVIDAAARGSDFVMVAIMGAAAIEPALAAIRRGVVVALANKECVVAAGAVFRDAMLKSGAQVLPVDSEHNAIFQVLGSGDASEAELVTITASGGPFREWSTERMRGATVEEAVAHPNWAMGRKISLDSATLMNKGLELIEADFLFALPPEKLAVVVHPQSIVHCLVSYEDGTTMAHLSAPDMRTPIAHALGCPRRIPSPSRRLDLAALGSLVFHPPAHDRFPALNLAIDSMRSGGMAPTVLNAANEIAVQAFLDHRIGFLDIPRVVAAALDEDVGSNGMAGDLESVLGIDARARVLAEEICQRVGT